MLIIISRLSQTKTCRNVIESVRAKRMKNEERIKSISAEPIIIQTFVRFFSRRRGVRQNHRQGQGNCDGRFQQKQLNHLMLRHALPIGSQPHEHQATGSRIETITLSLSRIGFFFSSLCIHNEVGAHVLFSLEYTRFYKCICHRNMNCDSDESMDDKPYMS